MGRQSIPGANGDKQLQAVTHLWFRMSVLRMQTQQTREKFGGVLTISFPRLQERRPITKKIIAPTGVKSRPWTGGADRSGYTTGFLGKRCVRRTLSATSSRGVHPTNALPQARRRGSKSIIFSGKFIRYNNYPTKYNANYQVTLFSTHARKHARSHAEGARNVCDTTTAPGISISRVVASVLRFLSRYC